MRTLTAAHWQELGAVLDAPLPVAGIARVTRLSSALDALTPDAYASASS